MAFSAYLWESRLRSVLLFTPNGSWNNPWVNLQHQTLFWGDSCPATNTNTCLSRPLNRWQNQRRHFCRNIQR
ncbi:hypothetical protein BDR03DRAFT_951802 [Suillus americanus]|nr:hypothetical protein BDR03DRAFT_951802 [Suillus americanus]